MFRKLFAIVAVVLISIVGTAANAAAIINPATGASGTLIWSGSPGTGLFVPLSSVFGSSGNTASITVANASTIDFSIADCCVMGDAFALQLDGVTLNPTSGNTGPNTRGPSATAYFSAFFDDIFLSAGSHVFSLFLTDSCCTSGGANASFSAVTAAAEVPEPAPLALLGLGLFGFVASRKRNHKS